MQKLSTKQLDVLIGTFSRILKYKQLKYFYKDNYIVLKYANFYVAAFDIDELVFEGDKVFIQSKNSIPFTKTIWYKKIHESWKKYLSNPKDTTRKFIFLKECSNYFKFITKTPNIYLNIEQRKQKSIFETQNFKCPRCNCASVEFNNNFFNCLICNKTISYKHQFNFCKMNKSVLNKVYVWDEYLTNYLTSDLNFYLYLNAITIAEQFNLNVDVDNFCESMSRYNQKGFDATDDNGKVYTYFWFVDELNYEVVNKCSIIDKYWNNKINKIVEFSNEITKRFHVKEVNIICVDIPTVNNGINNILNQKNYRKVIKKINDDFEIFLLNNKDEFSKNINKIYFLNNLTTNHYVIGLREAPYAFLRYLLGKLDSYLYAFDPTNKKIEFLGPQHGLMEMYLNEIDEIVMLNRLDLSMHSFEYSIASSYLFKKSFIAQEEIMILNDYFQRTLQKTNQLKTKISQKIFKKVS